MLRKLAVTASALALALTFALTLGAASGAFAQESPPAQDPIGSALIPPDVVMAHQEALGLDAAQKSALQTDILEAQQRFTGAQWKLNAATEKLAGTLRQTHVDSTKAQAELDAVLDLEREIKHAQLTLMIQIKNQLTAEQQATARKFAHEAGAK